MNKEKRNKQGTLVVSLDFELFWGVQDCNTLNEYPRQCIGRKKGDSANVKNICEAWYTCYMGDGRLSYVKKL